MAIARGHMIVMEEYVQLVIVRSSSTKERTKKMLSGDRVKRQGARRHTSIASVTGRDVHANQSVTSGDFRQLSGNTGIHPLEREFVEKDIENTNKGKTLLQDGVWLVPPSERPVNWERLGGLELPPLPSPPEPATNATDELLAGSSALSEEGSCVTLA